MRCFVPVPADAQVDAQSCALPASQREPAGGPPRCLGIPGAQDRAGDRALGGPKRDGVAAAEHGAPGGRARRERNGAERVTYRLRTCAVKNTRATGLPVALDANRFAVDSMSSQRSSHFGSRFSINALSPSSASRAIRFSTITSET